MWQPSIISYYYMRRRTVCGNVDGNTLTLLIVIKEKRMEGRDKNLESNNVAEVTATTITAARKQQQ